MIKACHLPRSERSVCSAIHKMPAGDAAAGLSMAGQEHELTHGELLNLFSPGCGSGAGRWHWSPLLLHGPQQGKEKQADEDQGGQKARRTGTTGAFKRHQTEDQRENGEPQKNDRVEEHENTVRQKVWLCYAVFAYRRRWLHAQGRVDINPLRQAYTPYGSDRSRRMLGA